MQDKQTRDVFDYEERFWALSIKLSAGLSLLLLLVLVLQIGRI